MHSNLLNEKINKHEIFETIFQVPRISIFNIYVESFEKLIIITKHQSFLSMPNRFVEWNVIHGPFEKIS